jgi:deoxycytidine triphosphate deaminase
MLNSEEIFQFLIDPSNLAIKQQVGVDLTLETVKEIVGNNHHYLGIYYGNYILKDKTFIEKSITYKTIDPTLMLIDNCENKKQCWHLNKGIYSLTFNQGCKLPNNIKAEIVGRSSLNRLGALIRSSIYDPGFETEQMGVTLYTFLPIVIEYQARVAQIVMDYCNPIDNLYNGQFQKEKDIK